MNATVTTAPETTPAATPVPADWWGTSPEGAIAGWSARAIADRVSVPVLTPSGRHKRVGGRPQYRTALRVGLLPDRQGSFGPEAIRRHLAKVVNEIVIPWVDAGIDSLNADLTTLDMGGGLTATYRAHGGYIRITVLVASDDAAWTTGRWSAKSPIPAPGDRVHIQMNGFGAGTVLRRFVEHGYTGVVVLVDDQPEWHQKQNPDRPVAMVFGAELKG